MINHITIRTVTCVSPGYLQKYGELRCPEDILQHACIIDTNYKDGAVWHFEQEGNRQSINVQGQHYVNRAIAVKELAIAHNGIALCPTFGLGDAIKSNQLKVILPDYKIEKFGLHAVYSHRRHLSEKVQLFMALLKEYFSELPDSYVQETKYL